MTNRRIGINHFVKTNTVIIVFNKLICYSDLHNMYVNALDEEITCIR